MKVKIFTAIALYLLVACNSDNQENPIAPDDSEGFVSASDAQGADAVPDSVEEAGGEDLAIELPAAYTEDDEGVITLNVVPQDLLPNRLEVCVSAGVVGEVIESSFTCTETPIIDCKDLNDLQVSAAKNYLENNKEGYYLWACSQVDEESSPSLHLYLEDENGALKVFNLALQAAEPAPEEEVAE